MVCYHYASLLETSLPHAGAMIEWETNDSAIDLHIRNRKKLKGGEPKFLKRYQS
jgi:hypothetical protein